MTTTSTTSTGTRSVWENWDFRLFLTGQFVTNVGDSLYTVAVMWLVYELSGSTVLTGIANAILLLPWLLQILAGPIVDRLPLKSLLVGSQILQGVVVLVIPLAAITGRLSVGVVFAVIPVLTLASLVMSPMRSALLPRIVADENLSRANSALATVTLGLDMVFDALGGAFIAIFGVTALFLFDSVTFAVAALLFAGITLSSSTVRTDTPPIDKSDSGVSTDDADNADSTEDANSGGELASQDTPSTGADDGSVLGSYLADIRDGIDILRGSVFVELVMLGAVANLTTGVTLAILPAFGSDLGGPTIYGLLLGALGVGRLVGSLLAPYLETVAYGRLILVSYLAGTCCWLAAALISTVPLTLLLFSLVWVPAGVNGVLTSTLNQSLFPDSVLGRISSIKGTAPGATLPIGSLLGGGVAELLGVQTTIALAAAGFGATGIYFLVRSRLRRLPAVADADPADFDITISSDRTRS